jgi:histone H3/H4
MSSPVKLTTLKKYLKSRTDLRVGDPAVESLLVLLHALIEFVADTAKALAEAEDRNTVKDRDLQAGFEAYLRDRGPELLSSTTIHSAITGIDNDTFTSLIAMLRSDLEADS